MKNVINNVLFKKTCSALKLKSLLHTCITDGGAVLTGKVEKKK